MVDVKEKIKEAKLGGPNIEAILKRINSCDTPVMGGFCPVGCENGCQLGCPGGCKDGCHNGCPSCISYFQK